MSQVDFEKVEASIGKLEQALADDDLPQIGTQLMIVQKELQATPYLVDMLKPEDIGVLIGAERKRMDEDILADTAPKKKATRKKKAVAINLKDLESNLADDF